MTKDEINELTKFLDNFDMSIDDQEGIEKINKLILDTWDKRIEESVSRELIQKLGDVEIKKTRSHFDLVSDEQGATVYKLFFDIGDKDEKIEAIVKFVLYHNKSGIYLGSRHASEETYKGKSKILGRLFKFLKTADKDFGFFHPVDFYEFVSH